MVKKTSVQNIAFEFIHNKNNKTFSALISRLKPGLTSFAYKFIKDKDLAKEIVAQTFINIWEKSDQYNNEYNFSTWAYAIAKNEALNLLRVQNRMVSYNKYSENNSKLLAQYDPVFNMNTEYMSPTGEELVQKLFDASISIIQNLEEPYKTVMIEREINQKQLQIIAEDLGWNLSTVKTRLRKARKDVAEVLYKKYPDLIDSYFGNENN